MDIIKISDYVSQCYSNEDGQKIFEVIKNRLELQETVQVSLEGFDIVSSSFVNSAFIQLLDNFSFDTIKSMITFIHSNKSINDLIKIRFQSESKLARKL